MAFREDWNDDAYMDWADQERIVRQEVSEMEKQRRREKGRNEEQSNGTI